MSMLIEETVTRRKFTVDEFYQMNEAGFFNEDPRVELVEGQIINMAPIGSNHSSVITRLFHMFTVLYSGKFTVSSQNPLRINSHSEIQPDIQVLKFRKDYYKKQHPMPQEAILIIEVADTSFNYDRTVKAALYASSGIRHYCIVNTLTETVEYFSKPENNSYSENLHLTKMDKLEISENDFTLELNVHDIFPVDEE